MDIDIFELRRHVMENSMEHQIPHQQKVNVKNNSIIENQFQKTSSNCTINETNMIGCFNKQASSKIIEALIKVY
jgi:hypothetical protein